MYIEYIDGKFIYKIMPFLVRVKERMVRCIGKSVNPNIVSDLAAVCGCESFQKEQQHVYTSFYT